MKAEEREEKKVHRKRDRWTMEEESCLRELTERYGHKRWKLVAKLLNQAYDNDKTAKQCRDRWNNYVKSVGSAATSEVSSDLLCMHHTVFGNKWTKIAQVMNTHPTVVKNVFYNLLRKVKLQLAQRPDSVLSDVSHFTQLHLLDHLQSTMERDLDPALTLFTTQEFTLNDISAYKMKLLTLR